MLEAMDTVAVEVVGVAILIVGDIVKTVAVESTLDSVLVLAVLVVVRTVLSLSLDAEIDGVAPRRRAELQARTGDAADDTQSSCPTSSRSRWVSLSDDSSGGEIATPARVSEVSDAIAPTERDAQTRLGRPGKTGRSEPFGGGPGTTVPADGEYRRMGERAIQRARPVAGDSTSALRARCDDER